MIQNWIQQVAVAAASVREPPTCHHQRKTWLQDAVVSEVWRQSVIDDVNLSAIRRRRTGINDARAVGGEAKTQTISQYSSGLLPVKTNVCAKGYCSEFRSTLNAMIFRCLFQLDMDEYTRFIGLIVNVQISPFFFSYKKNRVYGRQVELRKWMKKAHTLL